MTLNISGPEAGKLSEAIESAYPAINNLQQVLEYKLNDNIYNYAGLSTDFPDIRFKMIKQYNARYAIDKLVSALLDDRRDNGLLAEFAWRHKIVYNPPGAVAELTSSS